MYLRNSTYPLLAIGLCMGGPCLAQSDPYYVGVSQAFLHQSNIFRVDESRLLADGSSRSDTVSVSSLVGGFDQTVGRQRLTGSVSLNSNRYSSNDKLNNQGYGINLGADWSTVNNISGTAKLGSRRSLKQFSNQRPDTTITTERNIETTTDAEVVARLGVVTRYTAEVGLSHMRRDLSEASSARLNFHENALSLGVRYQPSNLLRLGVSAKVTHGQYPQYFVDAAGNFSADAFKRMSIDLTGEWRPTGESKLEVRLAPSRTRYDKATVRDFTGVVGEVSWVWKPTGKLRLESTVLRDNGDRFTFDRPDAGSTLAEESRVSTLLRLQASLDVTSKVQLSSALSWAHRQLAEETPIAGGGTSLKEGSDNLTGVRLAAKWQPTRSIELGCRIEAERRSTNTDPTLRRGMTNNTFGCTGQFVIQ
jgi:hypothetical protein